MKQSEIRAMIRNAEKRPFVVHTDAGTTYKVTHRDFAIVGPDTLIIAASPAAEVLIAPARLDPVAEELAEQELGAPASWIGEARGSAVHSPPYGELADNIRWIHPSLLRDVREDATEPDSELPGNSQISLREKIPRDPFSLRMESRRSYPAQASVPVLGKR